MSTPHSSSESIPDRSPGRWFAEDVYAHDSSLKAYLRQSFPAVRDIDDVVQDSYVRIWKARAIQPIKSAKAFLFTIARRVALDVARHNRRSPIDGTSDFEKLPFQHPGRDASDLAATAQEVELLATVIDSLPARCREVFMLRRLQGVSQKEIALRLGISEQTVQVQAARGLRKVEAAMTRKMKENR
ncbi:MAG: RNA polymerase sigma factor [Opitutus sp.]